MSTTLSIFLAAFGGLLLLSLLLDDIAARLAPVPVTTLDHGATLMPPGIDWAALAG